MPAEVAFGVVLDDDLAFFRLTQRDCPLERADKRVIGLDAAVEDADPDPCASRIAERPVARDALGPFDADADGLRGGRRQAPRRQRLAGVPLGLLLWLRHAPILNSVHRSYGSTQRTGPTSRVQTAVSDTWFCQGQIAPKV